MKNRIKELRSQKGLLQKELAFYLGVSQGTMSFWESGKIDIDTISLQKLADFFGVSVDYLLCHDSSPASSSVRVPVFGNVAAGIPIEAITDVEDWEELSPDMARSGQYVALKIHGDSMEPKMSEGDVVIVRLQEEVASGDTAIVFVNGDSATCKKVRFTLEGILLISNNPKYDPMFYTKKQIAELPVRIFGKVVELRCKL